MPLFLNGLRRDKGGRLTNSLEFSEDMIVILDKEDMHITGTFRKYSAKFHIVATAQVVRSRNELETDVLNWME